MSAQLRNMDPGLIELFVDGKEDGLPDAGRLDDLGLGSGSVGFMLFRQGWRWEESGSTIALSGEGLVARRLERVYWCGGRREAWRWCYNRHRSGFRCKSLCQA